LMIIQIKRINMRNDYPWLPPSIGTLKWNVDASSNNKPRPWGISGVLKDHRGKFLCIFSCSTSSMKFNETTYLAIQKAMLLSINCYYAFTNQWVVESNFYNAITWIKRENVMRPSRLQTEFNDIFNACNRLLFVCFDHVHKKKLKLYCKLFGFFFNSGSFMLDFDYWFSFVSTFSDSFKFFLYFSN
jgi:hypothetical protein